jgi:hypothetical protein
LTKNIAYHVRAYAINAIGTSYGSEEDFRTLADPVITTLAATNIVTTTARLNASVTDDGKQGGGEPCTVKFAYTDNTSTTSYAAIMASTVHTEVTATGTYTTGRTPYYDISGLTISHTYNFSDNITNSVSSQYGSVLSFSTLSDVCAPTSFTASSTSTAISLVWVKGVGASNTLIRYKTSTYPTDILSGTWIYGGVGNSHPLSGLIPGTNYFISAWGLSGGVYSDNYTTVMVTTLAPGAETTILAPPATPSSWNQLPSTTTITNLPFYEVVNYFATSYETPNATMWYGLSIFFSVALGFFVYWRGNKNILAAMLAVAIGLAIGALLHLTMLWILVFFCLVGASMEWFASRR